jgi:hypothetical protein
MFAGSSIGSFLFVSCVFAESRIVAEDIATDSPNSSIDFQQSLK